MIAKEKVFLTALFMLLAGESGIAKMEMSTCPPEVPCILHSLFSCVNNQLHE